MSLFLSSSPAPVDPGPVWEVVDMASPAGHDKPRRDQGDFAPVASLMKRTRKMRQSIQLVACWARPPIWKSDDRHVFAVLRGPRQAEPPHVKLFFKSGFMQVFAFAGPSIETCDHDRFVAHRDDGPYTVCGDELAAPDGSQGLGHCLPVQIEVGRLIHVPQAQERLKCSVGRRFVRRRLDQQRSRRFRVF